MADNFFFNKELETADRESLANYQLSCFQELVGKLWEKNRFYTNKWKSAGITDSKDLVTWQDFKKLPFTKKTELVEDQLNNPPYGTNLSEPLENYVRFHQTSGTTGKPLKWLDTDETWHDFAECWAYVLKAAGVAKQDSIYFPFSFGPFVGFWSAFSGAQLIGAMAIPGGGQDTPTRLNFIVENKPDVICCTPSYALRLAEVAEEMGIDLTTVGVKATIHAGEPGASIPATRDKIAKAWGSRVYDHHGMTEVGAISFTCTHPEPGVHLNEAHFILEIINPETGEPVVPGQEGELVVTNLKRSGMPVVRYRTGDKVRPLFDTCGCGRNFIRMDGGILGRVDDMLIVRGVNVFPSAIENIVRRFPQIDEFRIEVYKERQMDEVNLIVEISEEKWPSEVIESTIEKLREKLRADLQIRVACRLIQAGTLPRFEMKAKRLVRVEKPSVAG